MRATLYSAPWCDIELTDEGIEALQIIGDNVWRDASIQFAGARDVKNRAGKSAPKGMQRYLNDILKKRFLDKGWDGDAGYFVKESTWVRITFRHQMSLGSDIVDAIKVCKKEGMELAMIFAATRQTLNLVSPNDAAALISFEKLQREVFCLDGAIDIPLVIGELIPMTSASKDINVELLRERPRDIYVPNRSSI